MPPSDPLLSPNAERFSLFPIQYDDIHEFYKKAQASYWTAEELDLAQDIEDWAKLTGDEQHFIKQVLAFFAGSDGIVNENIASRFCAEIQVPEARAFYTFQQAMETVHSETYSLLIETYVRDGDEKKLLFNAVNTSPSIASKAQWATKWMSSTSTFAERLVAFACVEGIHFSASFCAIFWLKKRGLMPGLSFSNQLISRDEGLHTDFACLLYSKLLDKLPAATIVDIIKEAVEVEHKFVRDALPVAVIGMNAESMCEYVEFVGDRLLLALGVDKVFETPNPFAWMEGISLQGKTNFFEARVAEYQRAGVMQGSTASARHLTLDADF